MWMASHHFGNASPALAARERSRCSFLRDISCKWAELKEGFAAGGQSLVCQPVRYQPHSDTGPADRSHGAEDF